MRDACENIAGTALAGSEVDNGPHCLGSKTFSGMGCADPIAKSVLRRLYANQIDPAC